mmetsp:Transcript_21067/g.43928  ORF Transcript_21067/g.43928 Transcript_21067/m.43928 type:complete len:218 (-) Transcript_21067:579-1232(-)
MSHMNADVDIGMFQNKRRSSGGVTFQNASLAEERHDIMCKFHAAIVSPRSLESVPEDTKRDHISTHGNTNDINDFAPDNVIEAQTTPHTPPEDSKPKISFKDQKDGIFTPNKLTVRGSTPPGVDPTKKEQHLSDESFKEIFGCTKGEFYENPRRFSMKNSSTLTIVEPKKQPPGLSNFAASRKNTSFPLIPSASQLPLRQCTTKFAPTLSNSPSLIQ